MTKHFGSRHFGRKDPSGNVELNMSAYVVYRESSDTYPKPQQDVQVQDHALEHWQSSGSKCVERRGNQGDGDSHQRHMPAHRQ